MKKIEFAWRDGASTAQAPSPGSRVFYLRQHKDADAVPGPTEYTGIVEIYSDGKYEFKLFAANQNIPPWLEMVLRVLRRLGIVDNSAGTGRGPTRAELVAVSGFIESLPGVEKGSWRRIKKGIVKEVANEVARGQ